MSEHKRPNVTITVRIEHEVELTHAEVWPDWDGAEVLDAAAVVETITGAGGLRRVLRDWCLDEGMTAEVVVSSSEPNPAYSGPDALFPELAPVPVIETRTTAVAR